uniref:H15 domain-containing protein n=1 Tax=Cannabis sativa TaxID=3483 RepID=A0A803NSA4_CANSA
MPLLVRCLLHRPPSLFQLPVIPQQFQARMILPKPCQMEKTLQCFRPSNIKCLGSPLSVISWWEVIRYNTMIFEALSTLKEPNGSDTSAIVSYIEEAIKYKAEKAGLTRQTRKGSKLLQGEKQCGCLIWNKDACTKSRKSTRPLQTTVYRTTTDVVDEAGNAAYKIAEAENKSFVAAEAVKEADRISEMAEDTESLLQLAKEIFEKCNTRIFDS